MSANLITELKTLETEFKSAIARADTAATDRLNTAISDMEAKIKAFETAANRPAITGDVSSEAESKAFDLYLRKADKAETKAMSALVPAEGGYTVPKVIDNAITKLMIDISPLRSVARVVSVSTPDFRIPVSTGGAASAWVGEKAARPETAAPSLTEIVPAFGELYASPYVTQTILEDSQFDIASYVAGEVANTFAQAEGAAFLNGDGTNKPRGLLSVTTALTADAARGFGQVQHVTSGAAADITALKLIDLVHSLKAGYRSNAVFLMNRDTLGRVRKLQDTTGQFLWQASLQAGVPSTLLGFPVIEAEDMPTVAAGSLSIAFGDFTRAYVIADRVGTSMLVNPYVAAPYVAYQSRKRVGGTVVDSTAYKLLKTGA
ncbi:phage major capsid protein [Novosphingobium sp. 9U]|uniref:phage major capsid protein n=1 Tax=Novosphingobium sp. 9U TaxID=2653158 RepID=UPI0012EF55E4|nr:phage major capsid protein [Novosphingobium sp. 9U]VWX51765.1 Capsid protein [Novosphingobium sp. 9U]